MTAVAGGKKLPRKLRSVFLRGTAAQMGKDHMLHGAYPRAHHFKGAQSGVNHLELIQRGSERESNQLD